MNQYTIFQLHGQFSVFAVALCALLGCADEPGFQPEKPGPGLVFSFPGDGQFDVPVGARVVLSMTDPIDATALATTCTGDPDAPETIGGGLCLVGPAGWVDIAPTISGERGAVIHIEPDLQPGATYQLYIRPELLGPDDGQSGGQPVGNLATDRPMITFHTRADRAVAGQPPTVVRVNGDDPRAYREVDPVPARRPTLDFTTVRVLFSEPMDPASFAVGDSVICESASGEPVPGTLLVHGPHLTFDPDADLAPGERYTLRLSERIRDGGGEALAATSLWFTPRSSRLADGTLIEQVLDAEPAAGDPDFPGEAVIAGVLANTIDLASPLVGQQTLSLQDGRVAIAMADPQAFAGVIPIVVRKGQTLQASGIDVDLGGVIPTGLSTGDIRVTFVSDASGFITRNPYRDPELPPDDAGAPISVELTFDMAITARDELGNAVLNQTIMNVQATGAATVVDGALAIETVGTMVLDLLGIAVAPANLIMRLQTNVGATVAGDSAPPVLRATHPAPGSATFPVSEPVVLTFDEPIGIADLSPEQFASGALVQIEPGGDAIAVDATVTIAGSALVIAPRAPLAYDREYRVTLTGAIRDLAGNLWSNSPDDPLDDTGAFHFRTPALSPEIPLAPVLTALYPGAPCALVDGADVPVGSPAYSPGRCAGGEPGDDHYRPFVLPANRAIEGYFNQPMRAASVQLGLFCDIGAVRVEEIDDNGACTAAVPGTLTVSERSFRFVPGEPWRAGQTYRLTLSAGADGDCSLIEICGENDLPLNTDPLAGLGLPGGPDIAIPFTAAEATEHTYLPAIVAAPGDVNGNGYLDDGEVAPSSNRAAVAITETSGIVDSAQLTGADCDPDIPGDQACIYVAGTLPVEIGDAQAECSVDTPTGPSGPGPAAYCVPSMPFPQVLVGTSVSLDAVATIAPSGSPPFTIGMTDVPTGPIVMRVRDNPDGPIVGLIVAGDDSGGDSGGPRFVVTLDLYMDAPDLPLENFNLRHSLHSSPLTVTVAGPVSFLDNGRLRIDAHNIEDIDVVITLESTTIAGNAGTVTMTIPAGALRLQLSSPGRH